MSWFIVHQRSLQNDAVIMIWLIDVIFFSGAWIAHKIANLVLFSITFTLSKLTIRELATGKFHDFVCEID